MRKTIIVLALLPFVFLSCSEKATKKVDNPGVMYVDGVDLMKKKKYDQAIEKFSAVRDNYPFDPIADVAMVKLGDAYFEKKEYLFAAGVYTDFVTAHPDDENVPYVLWRLADCFEKLSLTIDRDQAYILKAIERLTYLKNRYPSSQYAREADESLLRLNQKLADRELYVGDFYYRTANYNASIIRLEYLLSKFPGAQGTDKALYILAAAYRRLDNPEKAQQYAEMLRKEYPSSTHAKSQVKEESASRATTSVRPPSASINDEKKTSQVELKAPAPVVATTAEPPGGNGSGIDANAKPTDQIEKILTAAGADKQPLALPLKEEETTSRRIELRPPAPAVSPTTEEGQKSQDAGQQEIKSEGQKSQGAGQQETKSEGQKDGASKAGEKPKAFGFFQEKKPVDIVADMMEGLEKGKIIMFKGNVVAKQDDLQIFSDTLTAYLNEENDEIDKAVAKGNVKIIKAERTATCQEALFENAKGEITLTGNVIVYSGTDRLAGDTVIYYINEDRVTVESEKDKKVRVTVQPK
jgi:outer membrane protein assembly factor BamD